MSDIGLTNAAVVQYSVEIDGSRHSEYVYFVDAIKIALILREQNLASKIKLRDLFEPESEEVTSELAA
jgi:hypothetical protein